MSSAAQQLSPRASVERPVVEMTSAQVGQQQQLLQQQRSNVRMNRTTTYEAPLGMPSEARLWRALALCVSLSLFACVAIGGGLTSALGLNFHLQSIAAYAMALAVVMFLCSALYCVYCSQ
jgi:hypothetical protein